MNCGLQLAVTAREQKAATGSIFLQPGERFVLTDVLEVKRAYAVDAVQVAVDLVAQRGGRGGLLMRTVAVGEKEVGEMGR